MMLVMLMKCSQKLIIGTWDPIEVEKNVWQRLGDQDSSRRWVLICPSQLIGLKKRIRLGASSSWDSRTVISVLRTDSSTVDTMRCCERKLNCSWRREPTNLSLRSRKGCQWSRICLVTLSWEGMTATPALETDLSSRVKEVSKRWSSRGRERGAASWCWGTPSWELSRALAPTLPCDWDDAQTSLRLTLRKLAEHVLRSLDDVMSGDKALPLHRFFLLLQTLCVHLINLADSGLPMLMWTWSWFYYIRIKKRRESGGKEKCNTKTMMPMKTVQIMFIITDKPRDRRGGR